VSEVICCSKTTLRNRSRLDAKTEICVLFEPDERLAGDEDGVRRHGDGVKVDVVIVEEEVVGCW
jgi:hypothetical protein